MFGLSKSLWAKFWLISTLCFVLCLANPILEEDSEVSLIFYDDISLVCFIHPNFRFWFLVTVGDKITKT